jgi:hypothetical protein
MSSYLLKDCTFDPLNDYYVTDNSVTTYSLQNYLTNPGTTTVVSLTLPTTLTGLPYDVTTCVTVFSSTNPGPGLYDLGQVIGYGFNACDDCMTTIALQSCDDGTIYPITTQNPEVRNLINTCPDTCTGCLPTVYLEIGAVSPPSTVPPTGCYSVTTSSLEPINIDFYNPTFTLTCSPLSPCLTCDSSCYLVTPCDGSSSFILTNPEPVGFSPILVDTIVEITVTLVTTNTTLFIGCATITLLDSCNPYSGIFPIVQNSTITFDNPPITHSVCSECFPPVGYLITRCDDPGITFTVSTDLSSVVGNIISGVTIPNCESIATTSMCSSVLKSQCWSVSTIDTEGDYEIVYTEVYADCDCCYKPCN